MPTFLDGPASPHFTPVEDLAAVAETLPPFLTPMMREAWAHAPLGTGVSRGIPFNFGSLALNAGESRHVAFTPRAARWVIFAHVLDTSEQPKNSSGFTPAFDGLVVLGRAAARYVLHYADGTEASADLRRGREIGHWVIRNAFLSRPTDALSHVSFRRESGLPTDKTDIYAYSFARAGGAQWDPREWNPPWVTWLWALQNSRHDVELTGITIEAHDPLVVQAATTSTCVEHPLRWRERRKVLVEVPPASLDQINAIRDGGDVFFATGRSWDQLREYEKLQIDLGELASVSPSIAYDNPRWPDTSAGDDAHYRTDRVLLEYSAHPDARLYWPDGCSVPLAEIEHGQATGYLTVPNAHQRVNLRVVDSLSGEPVAARVHLHGSEGEPLVPEDRHRRPVLTWLVDDGIDFTQDGFHLHSYVDGATRIRLPLGRVYIEATKGFEYRRCRMAVDIHPDTDEVVITLTRELDWRSRGWVTADTHVHSLSPVAALLQGAAEGVNLTNLLASQWGEYMTNTGDFDGRSTLARDELGSRNEYLVRVGTENRQQNLGHISLLAYSDRMILPLCSGGPDESALGDPVEILLTEWAERCRAQGGIVVMPHFPGPRCENAAVIVEGLADAVEMCAIGSPGIDPYSLSDWYRFLNCGYRVPAVGGTDKMMPSMPIGLVRTYARLRDAEPLTLDTWKDAIRRGETFVTYGPLVEFSVEGRPPGARIPLPVHGGTVDVSWQVETLGAGLTRVELVCNGSIIESANVDGRHAVGRWSVKVDTTCWMALLVRVQGPRGAELIAAHTSAITLTVNGSNQFDAADALSILRQIEGAMGFLDSVATRADADRQRQMRMRLTSTHRALHNRMHTAGLDHVHTSVHAHHEGE